MKPAKVQVKFLFANPHVDRELVLQGGCRSHRRRRPRVAGCRLGRRSRGKCNIAAPLGCCPGTIVDGCGRPWWRRWWLIKAVVHGPEASAAARRLHTPGTQGPVGSKISLGLVSDRRRCLDGRPCLDNRRCRTACSCRIMEDRDWRRPQSEWHCRVWMRTVNHVHVCQCSSRLQVCQCCRLLQQIFLDEAEDAGRQDRCPSYTRTPRTARTFSSLGRDRWWATPRRGCFPRYHRGRGSSRHRRRCWPDQHCRGHRSRDMRVCQISR